MPWTEYSLYTSVAELKGNLFDYHVDWDTCYAADMQLFSEQSCVWGADDFERLVQLPNGTDPGGKFIIVQSHARIPLERVREYCLSFAELSAFPGAHPSAVLPLCSPIFGALSGPPARSPSKLSGRPWNSASRPGIGLGEHAERRDLGELQHLRHRCSAARWARPAASSLADQ